MWRAALLSMRAFPQDKLLSTAGLELLSGSRKGSGGKKGETFSASPECKLCNISSSVKVSKMCPGWLGPPILPSVNQGNSDSLVAQGMMVTYRLLEKTKALQPLKMCILQKTGFFLSHSQEEADTILFIPPSHLTAIQIEAKGPHIIRQVPVNMATILFLFFQIILVISFIGLNYSSL